MSSLATGRMPRTDAEWAREVWRRLDRMENTQTLRVGEWVLTGRDGVLTAHKPGVPPIPLTNYLPAVSGDAGGPDRSSGEGGEVELPDEMPDNWWDALVAALTGNNGTLDDLGTWLDNMWASLWAGWSTVPAGAIVNTTRNMLWNSDFTGAISMESRGDFVWDSTVYLDNLTGAGQGSARLELDGEQHTLRSNVVNVAKGQVIDLSASFAADGMVITSGTPIAIGVATYNEAGGRIGTELRGFRGAITGPVIGWVGLPSTARIANITASYTVPEGVGKVAMIVNVMPEAAAGMLWVDKASMAIGGLIPQGLVDGLNQAWEGLFSGFGTDGLNGLSTVWENLLSMFGLGKPQLDSGDFDRNAQLEQWAQDVLGPLGVFLTPEFRERWTDLTHAVLIYLFGGQIDNVRVGGFSQAATDNMAASWGAMLTTLGITGSDRPDMTQFWAALLNPILKMIGLPAVGNDLASALDPERPKAPVQNWPLAGPSSTSATTPQNTSLYYVITAVINGVESAASNEVSVYISPAWLIPLAQVNLSWWAVAGATYNVYRRTSPSGARRRIATGVTGTSFIDRTSSTAGVVAEPGSAEAMAAAKLNGEFTVVNDNHQALTDAVTTGATGNEADQSTPADTAEAVATLRTSVADIRAALDDLQNEAETPTGGVRFVASNNGWDNGTGLWTVTGTGTPALTVNKAYTMVKQTGTRYIYAVYGTALSSDQQTVTITFNSSPDNPNGFSDSSQYGGSNLAILRATATLDKFVFARVWKNRIQFGYYTGGTRTMVGNPVALPGNIGPGVSVVVRCPSESSPYYFEARIAGNLIASHTFTSAQAPYGANYRRIGQGMMIGVGLLGDLFMPGNIQAVSAADMNVGPGFIKGGIGGVMRRYSDTAFNQQASFVSTVPENYFEALDAISPGITKLTGGGAAGFIVQDAGLYLAEAGFFCPGGANYYGATFFSGPFGQSGTIHSYNTYFTQFARGMAIIVAGDGDVIKPAASNGTTAIANMTGTTDGRNAFFSVARVG